MLNLKRMTLTNFLKNERGIIATEYAVVIAGVTAILLFVFGKNGTWLSTMTGIWDNISTMILTALQ